MLIGAEQRGVAREENLEGVGEPRSPPALTCAVPPGLPARGEGSGPALALHSPTAACRAPALPLRPPQPAAVRAAASRRWLSAWGCPVPELCSFLTALSCSSTPCCFPELVSPPPLAAVRGCCEITFQKMEQTRLQQRDFKWAGKLVAALRKGGGVQSIIRSPHPARCIFNGSLGLNV